MKIQSSTISEITPENRARLVLKTFLEERDIPVDYFLAYMWQKGYKIVPV